MADVTVGVKHISAVGAYVGKDEQAAGAIGGKASGAMWIQIGDVRLDANECGIEGFDYTAHGPNFHELTITFFVGRFQTVQWDADPEIDPSEG